MGENFFLVLDENELDFHLTQVYNNFLGRFRTFCYIEINPQKDEQKGQGKIQ